MTDQENTGQLKPVIDALSQMSTNVSKMSSTLSGQGATVQQLVSTVDKLATSVGTLSSNLSRESEQRRIDIASSEATLRGEIRGQPRALLAAATLVLMILGGFFWNTLHGMESDTTSLEVRQALTETISREERREDNNLLTAKLDSMLYAISTRQYEHEQTAGHAPLLIRMSSLENGIKEIENDYDSHFLRDSEERSLRAATDSAQWSGIIENRNLIKLLKEELGLVSVGGVYVDEASRSNLPLACK